MGKTKTRILWLLALALCTALLAAVLISCGAPETPQTPSTDTEAVTEKAADTEPATEPATEAQTTETMPTPHSIDETDPETTPEQVIYNIKPDCSWGNATEDSPVSFTFGNSINAIKFEAVDLTNYNYIEFDLYIPDVTVIEEGTWTANSQFEITSGGKEDSEEFCWGAHTFLDGITLEEGWNHIRKGFGDLAGTSRDRINFIRWYFVPGAGEKSISGCKIANLRFTANGSVEPDED